MYSYTMRQIIEAAEDAGIELNEGALFFEVEQDSEDCPTAHPWWNDR